MRQLNSFQACRPSFSKENVKSVFRLNSVTASAQILLNKYVA